MHDISVVIIQQDKFSIKFCHYTARQVWHKILPLYSKTKYSMFCTTSALVPCACASCTARFGLLSGSFCWSGNGTRFDLTRGILCVCRLTRMRLLTSALLLLLVADFSRAAVHRLSTEQLHKSDLWKDQTVHILLFSEQGTYSVVSRDRLGTVWT